MQGPVRSLTTRPGISILDVTIDSETSLTDPVTSGLSSITTRGHKVERGKVMVGVSPRPRHSPILVHPPEK